MPRSQSMQNTLVDRNIISQTTSFQILQLPPAEQNETAAH